MCMAYGSLCSVSYYIISFLFALASRYKCVCGVFFFNLFLSRMSEDVDVELVFFLQRTRERSSGNGKHYIEISTTNISFGSCITMAQKAATMMDNDDDRRDRNDRKE